MVRAVIAQPTGPWLHCVVLGVEVGHSYMRVLDSLQ